MEEIVKLIILSHKRAGRVETHESVANCSICIPESQADEYRECYPEIELIVHPDTVVGYASKVKWIYERYPRCFMLDDDLSYLMRLYDPEQETNVEPQRVYDLIQANAEVALQMGVKFFGFGKMNKPLLFTGLAPFSLSTLVIGGQFGFLEGFQIEHMPSTIVGSTDYFLTALNAHFNRMTFVDNRFAFCSKTGTFKSEGGMADIRDLNTEKDDLIFLKKKFGDAIELKKVAPQRKVLAHQYERTLKIPY